MTEMSVTEAKAHFTEILRKAEAGESTIVTRHGKVIAEINPPKGDKRRFSLAAIAANQSARGLPDQEVSVPDDFDEIDVFGDDWMDAPVYPDE